MKNLMKKGLSIFLAFAITFSSALVGLNEIDFDKLNLGNGFAVKTKAASVDDLYFEYDSSTDSYYVSGCSTSASGEVVIPSTYEGKSVTSIDYEAFCCSSIESIVIPDSVTSIKDDAFLECRRLKTVIIGNGVTSIGNSAFYCCESLESIVIPDSVTSIGSDAFYDCSSLTSIEIPDGVTSIGSSAFRECESLTSITIPDSVTSIGSYAFYDCKSLESIEIPDGVTSVASYVFAYCSSLTTIEIPDGVTSIGAYAFANCHFANIIIPKSVTDISDDAFLEKSADYGIRCKLPLYCYKNSYAHSYLVEKGYDFALIDGTTEENTVSGKIGAYNWSLNKLTGVLELSGSGKMVDFTTADAPWCEWSVFITEVNLPDGLTNIGKKAFYDLERVESIVIPDSVTIIDERSFYNWYSLKSIVIPDSVKIIGEYAFHWCTSLESVVIGSGVTLIDSGAFYYCISLESIVIPDSVTSIDSWAFEDCYSLKSIVIPGSVTSIGYLAFSNCKNLETIEFALDEKNCSKLTSVPDISDTAIKSVFLPVSIKSASSDVFVSDIETVTICNPEFEFNSSCGLNYNSTIIGFEGSTAETFAAGIGAAFVDIETVHNHEYKSFEEKGYCSFGRCICGKEEKVAHTDSDRNAICDGCSKNLNDINVDTQIKVLVEDGSINHFEFTAVQEGRYTITVNQECWYLALYNGDNNHITSNYGANQLSYNLQAGEKVCWRVQNANTVYPYGAVIPKIEIELTLTYTPSHEHNYTSTVTTQATCTTNGVKTYTCTCGDSYTQTIWSNGHSYGSWYVSVAGSCSEGVVIKRDCVNCDYSDTMSFSSSGKHTEVTTVSRATDTHDGSVITSCSVCGQKIEEKTIAKIASVELSETKYTYNGKVKTPSVTVKDSEGKKLDKDTDYTVTYSSGRKNPGVYTVTVKFKGNYGGTEKISFNILPKAPTSFDYTASSKTAVKLSWDASTGATGYIVYKYNANAKKYEKIAIVDGEKSYTVSSLKAGSSYKFKIRAYKELKDNTVIYSDYSSAITAYTKTATPTLKVSSGSAGVASLSWSNVAGETGYEVYYSTSKSSGYKKLGTYKADVVKASKKKLTSGKKYYFKVRAYKKTSDRTIYGGWSSVKSVKIK